MQAQSLGPLIRSLYRLQTYQFQPRIIPAVDAYFKGIAPTAGPEWKDAFADMAKTIRNPDQLLRLQTENPELAALTRNTCSITMLQGSAKINVIPPEASAQLDCRLLPDQDVAEFKQELRGALNDPGIAIEQLLGFTPAVSPTDNLLYRTIAEVTRQHYPNAAIVPSVSTGFTDSHFFRDRGIASYGYAPFLIPIADESGVHGDKPLYFFLERYKEAFISEMRAFIDSVQNGKPTLVTGEDGLQNLLVGLAAQKSLVERRPVKISEVENG